MPCSPAKRRAFETCRVEFYDDLLMLILVLLPAKSIFRFQCVSKTWKYVISDSFFHQNYYNLRKSLALANNVRAYIRERYSEANSTDFYRSDSESMKIKPMCESGRPKLMDTKLFGKYDHYFVNSSNGLILAQRKRKNKSKVYVIFNPVTRRSVNLIRRGLTKFCGSPPALALVCEENMNDFVLNYKVVVAGKEKTEHSYFTINTFCSKAKAWTTSTPSATGSLNDKLCRHSSSPFVADNVIYWFTRARLYLVVYYVESNTIQLVELPLRCRNHYSSKVTRSSPCDNLWLCTPTVEKCCIRFWMLPAEIYDSFRSRSSTIPSNAWILMHKFIYPAPAPEPAPMEETSNTTSMYTVWWRGDVRCEVPFRRFFTLKYRNRHNFNPFEFSPYMESLTLSAFSLTRDRSQA